MFSAFFQNCETLLGVSWRQGLIEHWLWTCIWPCVYIQSSGSCSEIIQLVPTEAAILHLSDTLMEARAALFSFQWETTAVCSGPFWGMAALISPPCWLPLTHTCTYQHVQSAHTHCLASAKLLLLAPALTTASTAWHSTVRHGTVRHWAMDAVPCQASHPTPFPVPLREVAASASLPESKWKHFFAAIRSRTSYRYSWGRWFSLAVLGYCEGTLQLSPLHARDLMQVVVETILLTPHKAGLWGLILNDKCSLWYLPRHPPSPQGWSETKACGFYSHTHSCGG